MSFYKRENSNLQGRDAGAASVAADPPSLLMRGTAVAFPNHYCWYVLLATLDFIVTLVILQLGGREVNAFANALLTAFGASSLMIFKALTVALVICICEFVARRRRKYAEVLAVLAIAVTAFPVVTGLTQLLLLAVGSIQLDL